MAGQFGVSGTPTTLTGRNTSNSVQVAEQTNNEGEVVAMATYGAKIETTENGFLDGSFSNEALNGQTTTATGAGVVQNHNLVEQNDGYATTEKTTVLPGPAGA